VADEAGRVFDEALADDLNTPEALAAVHGLVSRANALHAEGALTREGAQAVQARLAAMDSVFGVFRPESGADVLSAREQGLFDGRQEARRKREFARADELRGELERLGVVLEDTPAGTRWRRKR
jgi:cysteinyl-tRNA synthetase